jgi:hypothetical protein
VSAQKGDARLARLRGLVGRAEQRCGAEAADLRQAHGWLCEIARRLEPSAPEAASSPTGPQVRQRVESYLDELATALREGRVPAGLAGPVDHLITVLRRLGHGLYHCYDVPGLPRTDNDLEQFYRRVKTLERRITGHKRSDTFVVRVGGFAVYAAAASQATESTLLRQLATVPAAAWQAERATLWANQERQAKMRRFRLHRAAYLADLEARWTRLADPP